MFAGVPVVLRFPSLLALEEFILFMGNSDKKM